MNLNLEQRISAFIDSFLRKMHRFASKAGETRALKKDVQVKPSLHGERLDIRELRGSGGIRSDYDHKALRTGILL